jgi:hypothetical protein
MSCDLNRSINVGFLTSVIISTLSYFNIAEIKNLSSTKLLFLFVVFFVIATSMDYFNYCKTKCKNIGSSVLYGVFTASLIYMFYGLFVRDLYLNEKFVVTYSGNVLFLAILHYILCDNARISLN